PLERGGVTELRAIAHGRVDVEHGPFADEDVPTECYRSGLDPPGLHSVALEHCLLTDHRPCADDQQVGTYRHAPREDHNARPDSRAQRSQIKRVKWSAEEQTSGRARSDERLDDPEPHVGEAPQTDLLGFPATDEHPLRRYWNRADNDESRAT